MIIGSAAPNQRKYYDQCRNEAGSNIEFIGQVEQGRLLDFYKSAKVHALPSWFETCGLSTLEAAAMACNIVIADKGFTRDYFGNEAFYCDPGSPASIFEAIENAAQAEPSEKLQQRIRNEFTWEKAAQATLKAYKKVMNTYRTKSPNTVAS